MTSYTKPHIAISGLIGAGKTTLAKSLSEIMGIPVIYEPVVENEYLEDFYENPAKYSFQLQIYLLNKRFKQQQQLVWQDIGGIQDRSIYEDQIFAKMLCDSGLMEKRDYETYIELFNNMSRMMARPDFIIHLDVTPQESLKRIAERGRSCESNITLDYLIALHKAYEMHIEIISQKIPVIRVTWDEFGDPMKTAEAAIAKYTEACRNIQHLHN